MLVAKQHQAAITLLYVAPSTYVAGEYGRFDYGMLEADLLATGDKHLCGLAVEAERRAVPAAWSSRVWAVSH